MQNETAKWPGAIFEMLILTIGTAAIFHFLTAAPVEKKDFLFAAGLLLTGIAAFSLFRIPHSLHCLVVMLIAFATGFFVFSYCRFVGYIRWPLSSAETISEYGLLLYHHAVMALSVILPALLVAKMLGMKTLLRIGKIKNVARFKITPEVLGALLAGCWICALMTVFMSRPSADGAFVLFAVIAIVKAALTGCAEEICYRGLIQPAAAKRYGMSPAILFQALIYTAFHMHLGAFLFPKPLFLIAVFALGIVFGIIAARAKGLLWVILMHTAFNVVIEWHNIS